jgi:hypothetical protein
MKTSKELNEKNEDLEDRIKEYSYEVSNLKDKCKLLERILTLMERMIK